jgi:hypothetical protein
MFNQAWTLGVLKVDDVITIILSLCGGLALLGIVLASIVILRKRGSTPTPPLQVPAAPPQSPDPPISPVAPPPEVVSAEPSVPTPASAVESESPPAGGATDRKATVLEPAVTADVLEESPMPEFVKPVIPESGPTVLIRQNIGDADGATEVMNLDGLTASTDETVVIHRDLQEEEDES